LEWRPLIHLLFDSIKPVGGVGRVILNSNGVAKGAEAPICLFRKVCAGMVPRPDRNVFGVHLNWVSDVAKMESGRCWVYPVALYPVVIPLKVQKR
jgi:hypothetical protein